jgi:choline dehydrogenase-like flavoprotein
VKYYSKFKLIEKKAGTSYHVKSNKYDDEIINFLSNNNFKYFKYSKFSRDIIDKSITHTFTQQTEQYKRILPHSYGNFIELIKQKNIDILEKTKVVKVLFNNDNKSVYGVFTDSNITICGKNIILSAGALYSPAILQNSRVCNNNVGKNLCERYSIRLSYAISPKIYLDMPNDFSRLQVFDDNTQLSLEKTLMPLFYHRLYTQNNLFNIIYILCSIYWNNSINYWGNILKGQCIYDMTLKIRIPATTGHIYTDNNQNVNVFFSPFSKHDDIYKIKNLLTICDLLHKNISFLKNATPLFDTNIFKLDTPFEHIYKYVLPDWHFAGTCAMGSVVDTSFKVIGVTNLYVCDMSICKRSTSLNTMGMSYLLGVILADLL